MVAGEPSGDLLAARILKGIENALPNSQFTGIGGPALKQAGQIQWHGMDALSVFGYVDAFKRLPSLLRIYQNTKKNCLKNPPNVFVGIDAPDFNLRLEKSLKAAGIPTVQFVSPSIWAWRYHRIELIRTAVSHMLVLFPFEVPIYKKEGIPVTFVGHPLAQEIPLEPETTHARRILNLNPDTKVLGILPGSRASEIKWLTPVFLQTAQKLQKKYPKIVFVIPAVNQSRYKEIQVQLRKYSLKNVHVFQDSDTQNSTQPISWLCMQAADALLLASGTATLEAMMFKKPMVISYILSPMMRRIMAWQSGQQRPYTSWVGLPNILANKEVAPEFLQDNAKVNKIEPAVERALIDNAYRQKIKTTFYQLHKTLQLDTARLAAQTILNYV